MKKQNLVIITDCIDVAASEIKGRFASILENDYFDLNIDIVNIKEFSIINGSFCLRLLADAYPAGTCFYIVLNPVSGQPKRIIGKTDKKDFLFCGRNTGVFNWFIDDFGCKELYEVSSQSYCTFGGKNIYPPVLAMALRNIELKSFLQPLPKEIIPQNDIALGTIVHIDNFGIVKILQTRSLFEDMCLSEEEKVLILINKKNEKVIEINATYRPRIMAGKNDDIVICQGSSLGGLPEICAVRNHLWVDQYNIEIGDVVTFKRL